MVSALTSEKQKYVGIIVPSMPISFYRIVATASFSLGLLFMSATSAFAADNVRPTVGTVSPTSATVGSPLIFSTNYADNDSGVTQCELYVEFTNEGSMQLSGGTASLAFTFPSQGVYTVFVHCKDAAGNAQNGHNTSVVVSPAPASSDSTPPTVSAISPVVAQKDVVVNLQASYADSSGVTACRLMVNGFENGNMTLAGGIASKPFIFDSVGSVAVYALCSDAHGNVGTGTSVFVNVTANAPAPVEQPVTPPVISADAGLIKIECPAGAGADHPCRSVYYRTGAGTRHAFPNERVFFTWYANFDSVKAISAGEMASLQLGRNVTYRPGVRMVKFTTENKVYAVARGGLLRWVKDEATAIALYGSDWNKKIDDIADVFVSNYNRTGTAITSPADYSPSAETSATASIEANF
jgi:hypothetical protein